MDKKKRFNNLDIIRFVAASLVIFSHSFPITMGDDLHEPLAILTNHQTGFGQISVVIFFIISGYLITLSYERATSISQYLKSRFLRIFPGLIAMLVLTTFILGPLVSIFSIKEYFSNTLPFKYIFMNLTLILTQVLPSENLPGVFLSNPLAGAVNGSLWTLWFEFFCYIMVIILYKLKLSKKRYLIYIFLFCLVINTLTVKVSSGEISFILFFLLRHFKMATYFLSGMLFFKFRENIILKGRWAFLSLIVFVLLTYIGFYETAVSIFGSYILFFMSFNDRIVFSNFTKYGDFSYGIYIYAFPIQQLLYSLGVGRSVLTNTLLSFAISLAFAYLSWHLIEKRALALK